MTAILLDFAVLASFALQTFHFCHFCTNSVGRIANPSYIVVPEKPHNLQIGRPVPLVVLILVGLSLIYLVTGVGCGWWRWRSRLGTACESQEIIAKNNLLNSLWRFDPAAARMALITLGTWTRLHG